MLKKISAIVASLCFAAAAHAQITISANTIASTGGLILSSTGGILANGDIVRIGYIPSGDLSLFETGNQSDYSTLSADFTPIGEGTLPTTSGTLSEMGVSGNTMEINSYDGSGSVGSSPGQFFGTFNGVSSSYLTAGDALYLWVFNSSNPLTATQWGVFDGGTAWNFPSYPFPGSADLSTSTATTPVFGTAVTSGPNNGDYELANVSVVPEPENLSVIAAAVAIGVTFLRRRRK